MILCWFGHKRDYVAKKTVWWSEKCNNSNCCSEAYHKIVATALRWICKRCGLMREEKRKAGAWRIEHGKLLPDKKAWASWEETEKK